MDADETINSFKSVLIPFIQSTSSEHMSIVLDNARPHTSRKSVTFLENSGLRRVPFGGSPHNVFEGYPPNNPDLNPIECIWSLIEHRIYRARYDTFHEFISVLKKEWGNIKLTEIKKNINHLEKIVDIIIERCGSYSK